MKHLPIFSLTILAVGLLSFSTKKKVPYEQAMTTHIETLEGANLKKIEDEAFKLINIERKKKRLAPLKFSPEILVEARKHSQRMASKKASFSHSGFGRRIKNIEKKLTGGYSGENIAYNQGYDKPAKEAVKQWMHSSGHRHNILTKKFTHAAIGVAVSRSGAYYFTQIFMEVHE